MLRLRDALLPEGRVSHGRSSPVCRYLFTIIALLELLAGGPKSGNDLTNMPVLVPVAYAFGLIPAVVACIANWIARHMKSRMGVTVGASYAATSLSPF